MEIIDIMDVSFGGKSLREQLLSVEQGIIDCTRTVEMGEAAKVELTKLFKKEQQLLRKLQGAYEDEDNKIK